MVLFYWHPAPNLPNPERAELMVSLGFEDSTSIGTFNLWQPSPDIPPGVIEILVRHDISTEPEPESVPEWVPQG